MFPRRAVRWYDNRDTTLRVAIVGVFVSWCAAAPGFLISDFDFTNQNYTWDQYIGVFSNFPGCSLTYGEKELLYRCSRIRGVSVVVLLAKMQGESDLVQNLGGADRYAWRKDRAMGYGMIRQWREPGGSGEVKFYFFSGYSVQVWKAAERLRELFDEYTGPRLMTLGDGQHTMVSNAASYALYRYTPFYGLHDTHGYQSRGNELFQRIYRQFAVLYSVP